MPYIWVEIDIPSLKKLLSKKEAIREGIGLLIEFNNPVWFVEGWGEKSISWVWVPVLTWENRILYTEAGKPVLYNLRYYR